MLKKLFVNFPIINEIEKKKCFCFYYFAVFLSLNITCLFLKIKIYFKVKNLSFLFPIFMYNAFLSKYSPIYYKQRLIFSYLVLDPILYNAL